jgi:hypothetical protein
MRPENGSHFSEHRGGRKWKALQWKQQANDLDCILDFMNRRQIGRVHPGKIGQYAIHN